MASPNRDDTGEPKTQTVGWTRRGRVSSQAEKAARRQAILDAGLPVGERSRFIADEIERLLVQQHGRDAQMARTVVRTGMEAVGLKWSKDHPEAAATLFFAGRDEIAALARVMHGAEVWDALARKSAAAPDEDDEGAKNAGPGVRAAREALLEVLERTPRSFDVALCGRMVAGRSFGVEAAVSVGHSFTTSALAMEMDWFTGVDTLRPDAGAGHIDVATFGSGMYYEFSTVNLRVLNYNLGGDQKLARKALRAWLEVSVKTVPPGKLHATAAYVLPELALIAVRSDQPRNLENAFLREVRRHECDGDPAAASAQRLARYWKGQAEMFGSEGAVGAGGLTQPGLDLPEGVVRLGLDTLLDATLVSAFTAGEAGR